MEKDDSEFGFELPADVTAALKAKDEQLPLWPELTRIMPNHIARSPLFAPIKRGSRKIFDRTRLASRDGVEIAYTGKQLDMADQDVFLQALEYFKGKDIRTITINRADILKSIGKKLGTSGYKWLEEVMHRLKTGTLTITSKTYKGELSLLDEWERDEETGQFKLSINPKIKNLLLNNEFGYINWPHRMAIENKVDLSKWLQTYISAHNKGPQTHLIATLHKLCSSKSRINDFFYDAKEAFRELERVKEITQVDINKRSVSLIRL